ncbi:MAG TPA: HAMP domain-containing sensor histidine kinase [Chitinophagaceae bacterium]|nr:HAMP domain-containing sensor histidine kinase [Chitinophagaceae bacterium]
MKFAQFLPALWVKLIGDSRFTPENKAFNAISIISLLILLILLPFNIHMGLTPVWVTMLIIISILLALYYASRIHRKYKFGMGFYSMCSYLILIINYFYNSGSTGPTIYLFFLTFQLLIAFTATRQHLWWTITHVLITATLLGIEYFYPQYVPNTYKSRSDYFYDLGSSTFVILGCMYFITIYLRSNYDRERRLAEEHSLKIQQQNTQIIAQNEQLQKLNVEKSKILSVLSHDLRGPLSSITSVLELLTNYPIPEQRQKEMKNDLLLSTRNTSDLVSNLLSWSTQQMNGLQAKLGRVNVLQVVQQVLQVQQPLAQTKAISIRTHIKDDHEVWADKNLLEQSIRNIVNNAIKFTADGGLINISTGAEGERCIIIIKDNGIGMSAEQLQMLFRLDIHSTYGTNNEKGIGLGLALCKEFAALQHAELSAESEHGRGSTFSISIPFAS